MSAAVVVKTGALDMQVCVPKSWTDDQVVFFANQAHPCGTPDGWAITREGHKLLNGDPERQPCKVHKRSVHIMLHA